MGKGAACVVCDERRRDNLRMVEVHGRSLPMCHLCGFRTSRLEPVPVTIEGLRVMLRRDRRATDRRAGAMDTRVFPRERRDDERRRPPRELALGAHADVNTLPMLNLDDVLELDVDDIDILEATTVSLDPRAAVAALTANAATAAGRSAILIVFQNDAVVVVDKPAGVLTVPGRFGDDESGPALGRQLEQQLGQRLWPVHRLDREVSGLVLFARTRPGPPPGQRRVRGAAGGQAVPGADRGRDADPRLPRQLHLAEPAGAREEARLRGPARQAGADPGRGAGPRSRRPLAGGRFAGPVAAAAAALAAAARDRPPPPAARAPGARRASPVVGDALYGAKTKFVQPEAIALRSVRLAFNEADARALGIPGPIELPGFEPPDVAPVA